MSSMILEADDKKMLDCDRKQATPTEDMSDLCVAKPQAGQRLSAIVYCNG